MVELPPVVWLGSQNQPCLVCGALRPTRLKIPEDLAAAWRLGGWQAVRDWAEVSEPGVFNNNLLHRSDQYWRQKARDERLFENLKNEKRY